MDCVGALVGLGDRFSLFVFFRLGRALAFEQGQRTGGVVVARARRRFVFGFPGAGLSALRSAGFGSGFVSGLRSGAFGSGRAILISGSVRNPSGDFSGAISMRGAGVAGRVGGVAAEFVAAGVTISSSWSTLSPIGTGLDGTGSGGAFFLRRDLDRHVGHQRARLGVEQHRQAYRGAQCQCDRADQAPACPLLFRQHRVAAAAAAARAAPPGFIGMRGALGTRLLREVVVVAGETATVLGGAFLLVFTEDREQAHASVCQ
ncbi:hypothetical protein [Massilia sp. Se16.2.3]|uniref:hypothetical protein n=1 Tax=Massilia sp. Se16.2.3 TaxID=2709303 RepID=UPI001E2A2B5F|nr:hypothetical protein [Massilia sp. Se16.2.3]